MEISGARWQEISGTEEGDAGRKFAGVCAVLAQEWSRDAGEIAAGAGEDGGGGVGEAKDQIGKIRKGRPKRWI
jgi:hypothetical protein